MSLDLTAQEVVKRYFSAMRVRASGSNGMAALFTDDAVYVEPFSAAFGGGSAEKHTHHGKAAVVAYFDAAWQQQPPDMVVALDRLDIDGDLIRSEWTCTASIFPAPLRGYDVYTIRGGKIARLETTLLR